MGTDIHGVLQVREADRWRSIAEGFSDRNYNAFAILANVRNGRGFAGVETGEEFKPIAEPRGYPADFERDGDDHPVPKGFKWDREWRFEEDSPTQWMGDHSHSWITAADLESVEWQKGRRGYGVLRIAEFRALGGIGKEPASYCGDVWGQNCITIPAEEVLDNEEELHPGKAIYVRTWWEESYHAAFGERFMAFVRMMQDMGKSYGRENVRFVFGFDS